MSRDTLHCITYETCNVTSVAIIDLLEINLMLNLIFEITVNVGFAVCFFASRLFISKMCINCVLLQDGIGG